MQKLLNRSKRRLGCELGGPKGLFVKRGADASHRNGAIWRRKGWPIVKYRDALPWLCQNGSSDRYPVWVVDSDGPQEPLDVGPDRSSEGAIFRNKYMPGPWAPVNVPFIAVFEASFHHPC